MQSLSVQPNVDKGINTLIETCLRDDLLLAFINEDGMFKKGIRELQERGAGGAQELARFIQDLLNCRSSKIKIALLAASQSQPTPNLIKVIREVLEAPGTVPRPVNLPYTPEIIGDNRIGWTDGTTRFIREKAKETLRALGEEIPSDKEPGRVKTPDELEQVLQQLKRKLKSQANQSLPVQNLNVVEYEGIPHIYWHYAIGYGVALDDEAAERWLCKELEPLGVTISMRDHMSDRNTNRFWRWHFKIS